MASATERSWGHLLARRARGSESDAIAAIMAMANRTDIISFCGGVPDPSTFPGIELAETLRGIAASGDTTAFQYAPTEGLTSVREYVADRLAMLEGTRPSIDEVLITSGGIEALELISKAFLDTGDVVCVESPSYLGSNLGFLSFEARLAGVSMDEDGAIPEALAELLEGGLRPKLVYLIPDFQNPTGLSLSADRRPAFVELARRYGFLLIEDVTYRELTFDGTIRPALRSLGPDVVVQIGTFSKTFLPGTRLGWASGPPEIISRMVWAKQNTDQCAGALGSRLLEEYGRSGQLDSQIERARTFYAHRAAQTMSALERSMPPGVRWTRPEGGFLTWLTLPAGIDTSVLAEQALEIGVAFVPGAPFAVDGGGHDSLRLSFSRVSDDEISEGIARLGSLIANALEAVA